MSKHTPGPWANRWHNGFILIESGKTEVACIDPGISTERPCADARLIAAAPELLEELRAMTEHYVRLVASGDAGNWDAEEELQVMCARAAIAKATGEAA